jgi:hypothetical protein
MIRNRTREILAERGETTYTLYQKVEQACTELGESPPSYNTVLAFVRNNSQTINKRVWWLVATALQVGPEQLFDFDAKDGLARYAAASSLATA